MLKSMLGRIISKDILPFFEGASVLHAGNVYIKCDLNIVFRCVAFIHKENNKDNNSSKYTDRPARNSPAIRTVDE